MNADSSSGGSHTTTATATASGAPALLDRPLRTEPIRPAGDAGDGWGRAAAYDAYADGLHTYAIWSLHDHDAAVDALYCAFVIADRNVRQLRQPEYIQPWLYALLRRECSLRAPGSGSSPSPVSDRLRMPGGAADPGGSLASLERSLRRAEFHSLEWPESEGLSPAHREILELTIRHGLDSHGLGLVLGLGLGQSTRSERSDGPIGSTGSQGFGVLADAWRELERSLAAVAVAKASTEHCAQLAELTLGWSGRLNATLRAPLTEHVDGCTRCQHYLHIVIGTPAAPTILPFVAAPRALREIVLSELRDPELALRLGVDHDLIAARVRQFTPDGFPRVDDSSPARRRGGRRAAPKRTAIEPEPKRGTAQATDQASAEASSPPLEVRDPLPHRVPGANRPAPGKSQPNEGTDSTRVYRTPGSWAARVLPPETETEWRPVPDKSLSSLRSGAADGDSQDRFISTPSGRFATRTGLPRLASPVPEPPRGPDGKPRPPQHRSRPMRQAVLSAVTLGAVGAAAATTAALLGLYSDGHSSQLIDSMPSQDPGNALGGGGLTVSVSTPPIPLASSSVHSSASRGLGKNGATGPGIATGGSAHGSSGTNPGSGGDPGANAADFHVSVNQRAADPNSVTIVLRNSGGAPIAWQATARDAWIALSQSSGTLGGGQSQAIIATATSAAPAGLWTSSVTFAPGGAVVTLHGGYSNPSSVPASPPASGGSSGSAPGGPSAGSTPTPTPSSSGPGIGPSAARPTRTLPGGGRGGSSASPSSPSSPSSQTSAAGSTASAPAAASSAPAAQSPRRAAGRG